MKPRIWLIVGAVLFILSVVGVQLTDPDFDSRETPTIDFSEPPAEVVADSAKQFEYIDYAYRIDVRNQRSSSWRQVRTMRVDHSDNEFLKTGPVGRQGIILYGTDAVTFVRPAWDASWRVTPVPEVIYPARDISQPFIIDRLRSADATILSDNTSMLIVRLNVHSMKIASYLPGNSTIVINKRSGFIEKATVVYHHDRTKAMVLKFRLTSTDVDVVRPREIPFSPREVVWDLLRGPVFELFSPEHRTQF